VFILLIDIQGFSHEPLDDKTTEYGVDDCSDDHANSPEYPLMRVSGANVALADSGECLYNKIPGIPIYLITSF